MFGNNLGVIHTPAEFIYVLLIMLRFNYPGKRHVTCCRQWFQIFKIHSELDMYDKHKLYFISVLKLEYTSDKY